MNYDLNSPGNLKYLDNLDMSLFPEPSRIQNHSLIAKEAVQVITSTARYASMNVSTALAMAQRIIEIRSERIHVAEIENYFQECRSRYMQAVEKLVTDMNQSLKSISAQSMLKSLSSYYALSLKNLAEIGGDLKGVSLIIDQPVVTMIRLIGVKTRRSIRQCTHWFLDQIMYVTSNTEEQNEQV